MRDIIRSITIHCPRQIRALWPRPIAEEWKHHYPNLFDQDDLRLTRNQPRNHFCEWYAAIHLFQAHGVLSLIEKYMASKAHPRKTILFEKILSERERAALWRICGLYRVQAPDLLVYRPDDRRYWFAEVKGPGDRLSPKQRRSHRAIRSQLHVPVQVITVLIHGAAAA